jgi:DNA-binding NtrC family response regulator
MKRLLLFSEDSGLRSQVKSVLGREFRLSFDSNRQRVTELAARKQCDLVVLDLESCPASDRFEFLDELRRRDLPVAIITAAGNDPDRGVTAMQLLDRGIQRYCRKPLSTPDLSRLVRETFDNKPLADELRGPAPDALPAGCGQLIGSSAGSLMIYDLIRRVSNLDAFVLISGETGTGKELIARAIHSLSNRGKNQFVAVSCGAIPETLIEAELFGSERGAFTGASSLRTGYFEEAAGGTLLLDEIGELSQHTQVKLLRVLQQREFSRLGSSKSIPLRARVLFATNRNLKQMVAEGSFREDLYYRLNVVGITSEPLRNRPAEIPQLAEHFLSRYARAYGKNTAWIEPEAMTLLSDYAWPGNVRELENMIQSAIILSDDDTIRVASLPEEIRQLASKPSRRSLQWTSFEGQLQDYKIKLAMDAVKECAGNKTLAAQSLNISRTYLHRLIREPGEDGLTLKVA